MAAPPKPKSFNKGILSYVTPPKATTFSSIIPSSDARLNSSCVNADLYPCFEMLSKIGLRNT